MNGVRPDQKVLYYSESQIHNRLVSEPLTGLK